MARLPRLYRAVGRWADGKRKSRNYLTPEAANERRVRWEEDGAVVSVEPSYPVVFPRLDADQFDIPDMLMARSAWHDLGERLGIKPEAILSVTVGKAELAVEYDPRPDKPGKYAPKTWRIYLEDEAA